MQSSVPIAGPGLRVGLLGGSFDPPHAGHVHITRWALKAFGLDRVWWLVSPGNPLKPDAPADLQRRLAAARAIMRHPRVTRHRPRGAARHALHRRDAGGAAAALSGGALRLADGGGQPDRLPPLGPLGRHHGDWCRSVCWRAPGEQLARRAVADGAAFRALAAAAELGAGAGRLRAAGLDAAERADARPVVERDAGAGTMAAGGGEAWPG